MRANLHADGARECAQYERASIREKIVLRPLAVATSREKKLVARIGVALLGAAVALAACSNQGEGGRCDQLASNGGNDDCQDGLVCTSSRDLGSGSDLCCPPDRTTSTTAACQVKQAPIGGDAGIPDSSGLDAPAIDSASDAAAPDSATDGSASDGTAG